MIMSRRGFLTFPTKTFIWEYGAHEVSTNLNSGYTFSDSEYQLYNRGDNDNKIINDIEVYGDIQKGHHVINFGALSSFTLNTAHTTNFAYPPHNVRIYEGTSSTFTQSESSRVPSAQYWIDFNGKELTFSDVTWTGQASAPDNYIWATYDFDITDEVSSAMGGTGQMTRHSKTKFNSIEIQLLVIITKGKTIPSSNSSLYYEQAVAQINSFVEENIIMMPILVIGFYSNDDRSYGTQTTLEHLFG